MTLDERARLAVEDIQFAVDWLERETRRTARALRPVPRPAPAEPAAHRRGAGGDLALGALVFSLRALQPDRSVPATPVLPPGELLIGDWHPKGQEATWSTVSTDGSRLTDLGFRATCARWFPSGDRF